jgi:hypothetical protein
MQQKNRVFNFAPPCKFLTHQFLLIQERSEAIRYMTLSALCGRLTPVGQSALRTAHSGRPIPVFAQCENRRRRLTVLRVTYRVHSCASTAQYEYQSAVGFAMTTIPAKRCHFFFKSCSLPRNNLKVHIIVCVLVGYIYIYIYIYIIEKH